MFPQSNSNFSGVLTSNEPSMHKQRNTFSDSSKKTSSDRGDPYFKRCFIGDTPQSALSRVPSPIFQTATRTKKYYRPALSSLLQPWETEVKVSKEGCKGSVRFIGETAVGEWMLREGDKNGVLLLDSPTINALSDKWILRGSLVKATMSVIATALENE